MDLATDIAVFFVEGDDTKVSTESLTPSGTEAFDTSVFQVLLAEDLSAGDELDLEIKRSFSLGQGVSQNLLTILLGAAGLGLAVFGVWRFFAIGKDTSGWESSDREDILDSIVALDELYEEGEVDEAAYRKKRQALKDELQELMGEKNGG
jgi:hypothetical protein